jgi:rod shape-determining protein MreC
VTAALLRLLSRHRRGAVLASTLLVAFLTLTLQARQDSVPVTFAKRALLMTVAPFIKATAWVGGGARGVWREYVDLRGVQAENRRLRSQVEALQQRLEGLQEMAQENRRLQSILEMPETAGDRPVVVRVIGKDATNWFRTVLIDRGSADGLERNIPVVAPQGLVGRVVEVAPIVARVQLITDPVSSVGALVQRTRVTGIAAGDGGAALRLRYLPLMSDVAVGDRVVTSGMGGVFPKGIPLGSVVAVERRSGALFQEAVLEPTVDLSKLEEVTALVPHPGRAAGAEPREGGGGRPR